MASSDGLLFVLFNENNLELFFLFCQSVPDTVLYAAWSSPNQANITASINSIPMLNGTNFKSWKENLPIVLGVMDLDLALRTDPPVDITKASTIEEIDLMEKWEQSNRMCMMIIRKAIPEAFRGSMSPDIHTATETVAEVEARFAKNEKAEIGTILAKLTSKK
ncbi:uncharacterized protein [Rutidosis leptorrhynchoides]|uniref:uncharacterized protein n=1 Tax=Rutidosis leptorrhynchoides TaxID=125765 RepID=UPI003A98F3A2